MGGSACWGKMLLLFSFSEMLKISFLLSLDLFMANCSFQINCPQSRARFWFNPNQELLAASAKVFCCKSSIKSYFLPVSLKSLCCATKHLLNSFFLPASLAFYSLLIRACTLNWVSLDVLNRCCFTTSLSGPQKRRLSFTKWTNHFVHCSL